MTSVFNSNMIGSVEYITESVFATLPTNPAMKWIGAVSKFSPKDKTKTASEKYLKDKVATNRAESYIHAKTGEELGFDITYYPQPGSFDDFLLLVTGSATGLADSIGSFSLGLVLDETTTKYSYYEGCVVDSFTLNIPDDGFVSCDVSCTAADKSTWGTSTYIGTGSHATDPLETPLTSEDITSVQIDYGAGYVDVEDAINAITLKIENKVGYARDLASANAGRIKGSALTGRDITLELDMDYDSFDMMTYIRSLTELDVKFVLGSGSHSWTFAVSGVKFPEMPYEFSSEDLIGDKLSSLQCTGLSITTV